MNGNQNDSRSRLRISTLRPLLERCGYSNSLLRANVASSSADFATLLAFAHQPLDARSACIAVAEVNADSSEPVAKLKSLAAPIVFLLRAEGLEWWQQGSSPRQIGSVIPPGDVPAFFDGHQQDFAPDAVYRAKTWGRFDQQYQRSFVDLGLMPLVETEIGQKLQDLIASNVQSLKSLLKWETLSVEQGAWLLKSVFWFVSAKILRDKAVGGFKTADLTDVEQILDAVAEHFGAKRIAIGQKKQREALREVAERISKFSSLELATTESLAHVYENTLISKATRQRLGTHSTPSYLVDYIVGRLRPWIEAIDLADRNVFEPACGHAAFLVSAMRLLTELHPDGTMAQKRRRYLRKRVHGCEVDAFALEIARLSLSLTDIPNPNGWDLNLGDMFVGDTLETMASQATILLANPPFENFKEEDKSWYSKKRVDLRHVNKTAEMLSRVLPALPQGAVIGLVVPQGFLHSKNSSSVRKLLLDQFEIREICQLPDNVFTIAETESSVVVARKRTESAREGFSVAVRWVRENDIECFKQKFEASSSLQIAQTELSDHSDGAISLSELRQFWDALGSYHKLQSIAELGQGFAFRGQGLPSRTKTFRKEYFDGAEKGFVWFDKDLHTHELPTEFWVNLAANVILHRRTGTTVGHSQVLVNYARISRGRWRLKGLLDFDGHAASSRFTTVRPLLDGVPVEYLWALINSPLACAYSHSHSMKRDVLVGLLRQMPVPLVPTSTDAVVAAVQNYLKFVRRDPNSILQKPINAEKARTLMLRVDCEVLKLYDLPRELERQLLDYFAGWQREGVPFKFDRYFPEHFTDPISLSDYLAITADWPSTNRRRAELIEKDIAGTISVDEQSELEHLQSLASSRRNLIAPLPLAELKRLHREVVGGTE